MVWDKKISSFHTFLVNTLRVAKPEKGQKIEAMLIQMAQTGQLGGRIGEDELIGLLGKISRPIRIYLKLFTPKTLFYSLFLNKCHFIFQKKYLGHLPSPK